MLQTAPEGNVVCVKAMPPQHKGPMISLLLYRDLEVEGVPMVAMIDCGVSDNYNLPFVSA